MKHSSFAEMQCPIARTLDKTGEWWSVLILRDALKGYRRFDQFEQSLGIPPSSLTRRLKALVEAGMLETRQYSDRPPRHEYVLTERGRDFLPVIAAMYAWGTKHTPPESRRLELADRRSGRVVDPVVVDRGTGTEIVDDIVGFRHGPDARHGTELSDAVEQAWEDRLIRGLADGGLGNE